MFKPGTKPFGKAGDWLQSPVRPRRRYGNDNRQLHGPFPDEAAGGFDQFGHRSFVGAVLQSEE
jgi:hypothetical protein